MDIWTASARGDLERVRELIQEGQDVNRGDCNGTTPLMWAAERGHANVVVELIRAGADVSVVSSREWLYVAAGSTALHFAAATNKIECGVLLVEAGADMRTRNKNSKSPLSFASHDFQRAIQQAQSFSTKRIVAVIGNAEHGKSTLIAALQAEGNSLLKKLTNKFRKVQYISTRTTGIETVQFSSQIYGETLFYDFAGQPYYHGPHQSFLEALLSRPGVSLSLLLLLKTTDEEYVITRQVTYWLQLLSLTSAPSTPQVILVGSFLDQVESREEATKKLLRCTQSVQEQFHFNIQGPCLLDCRKPASEGIDQICTLFQENEPLQFTSSTLSYNLHWVLVQLRRSLSVPAITLHTFQSWLLKDAKLLLKNFPPAEQMCRDLTAVGHALFLPNKRDPSQSWLILDLQAILHVYGTLFSGSQGKVNQFGLLHYSQLTELFPKLDSAMVHKVLVSLEFCIQVDSSLMREELLKLIPKNKGDNWLYFPALVSALPLEVFPHDPHPQHLQWACWQLRTAKKHFISAHLLQTIIFRLAANHVFTLELSPSVREHCCSVWVNGLSWVSNKGVDVAVQISDSSVVQVVGRTKKGPEKLHQYMSTIVSNVIKTTAQLSPKPEATSYIVHPYTPAMWECAKATPPDSLYPVSSIIHSISDGGDHVLSLPRQTGHHPHKTSLPELFGGWSPPLSVVQDMDFKRKPQRGFTERDCSTLYHKAIRDKPTITLHVSKAMTIGPPRTGKTTLRHHLLELEPPEVSSSTPVMKTAETVSVCPSRVDNSMCFVTENKWVLVNNDSGILSLLTHLRDKIAARSSTAQKPVDYRIGAKDSNLASTHETKADDSNLPSTHETEADDSVLHSSYEAATKDMLPSTHESMHHEAAIQPSGDKSNSVASMSSRIYRELQNPDLAAVALSEAYILQFLDCGGQLAYHDILPLFVNIPAIYLNVFNVTEELTEYPIDELCSTEGNKMYAAKSALSIAEMVTRSAMTVHSLADRKVPLLPGVMCESKPRLMLVGTHLDKLDEKDADEKLKASNEILRKTLQLKSRLLETAVVPNEKSQLMFFPVNNKLYVDKSHQSHKHCKCKHCRATKNLKEKITKQAMEDAVKVDVPVKWYLHQLLELSQSEKPYYSYSELYERCRAEGSVTDAGEFHAMVTYFHALGLLIHLCGADVGHTEESACLVFTNPSHLFENISKLYLVQFEEVMGGHKILLKDEGKLTRDALRELGVQLNPDHFMKLLVQLFIGAEIKSQEGGRILFVPSVLTTSPDDAAPSGVSTGPQEESLGLAVTFENTSFIPCGVFTGMSARLQNASGWEIFTKSISRKRMTFTVGTKGTITLFDHATHISVSMVRHKGKCREYRDTVIEAVADSYCFLFHSKSAKDPQSGACSECVRSPYLVLGQTCQECRTLRDTPEAPHFAELKVDCVDKTVRCPWTTAAKELDRSECDLFQNMSHYAVVERQHTVCTLEEAGSGGILPTQTATAVPDAVTDGPSATTPPTETAAEEVLDHFRDRFIKDAASSAIMYELKHKGVIASGDVAMIEREADVTQQNQYLHECLTRKCTKEALMEVCNVMSAVRGNPKMNDLGKDMRRRLKGEQTH